MSFLFLNKGEEDIVIGLNFDFKSSEDFKIRVREDFVYGLYKKDGKYYVPFGVNRNGNFGSFINCVKPINIAPSSYNDLLITELVEDFVYGKYSFDEVSSLLSSRKLVSPIDESFHGELIDSQGREFILEPERGFKALEEKSLVLAGFSFFEPLSTIGDENSSYNIYKDIDLKLKDSSNSSFSVVDALKILKEHTIKGKDISTRVSFVYSSRSKSTYWALDGDFDNIHKNQF